jgi:ubiquinone/menaquinone biosynthesis C-methylase UbiE
MAEKITLRGRASLLFRQYIVHGRMRRLLGGLFAKLQSALIQPTVFPYFVTFLPNKRNSYSYVVKKGPQPTEPGTERTLQAPPERLWLGYGPTIDHYLKSGREDVDRMRSILADSGFAFDQGSRVLEFGCAAGRMLRCLNDVADRCEIWGTDISGDHIVWCKENLQPPFHFLITTTTPHLPFPDGYFDLIYAGSVFTHIDDLAEAWLFELARILKPGGRLYITICDNNTLRLLKEEKTALLRTLNCYRDYFQNNDFGMFTIGRFMRSLVFYDTDYLASLVAPFYDVVSVTPHAYHIQTAVLLRKR